MRTYQVNRPDPSAMKTLLEQHPLDSAGAILRLAWGLGLMREEITNLTWDQVSFLDHRVELDSRNIPMSDDMEAYLLRMHSKWGRSSEYVVFSVRFRTRMQPQVISRIARNTLDEAGQTQVRLVDLRHDFILRRLAEHDWPYVSQITGVEVRALQLHFAPYLREQKAVPPPRMPDRQIDEFELWKLLQSERDTPAGLALWLTWHGGLAGREIVSLTWDQVDLEEGMLLLPNRQVLLTAALRRLLKERRGLPAPYPQVLLSAEARRPMDISRLSRITRTALIRGGMGHLTMKDLWLAQAHKREEQLILQCADRHGAVSRNEVMNLLGLSRSAAYTRLRRMADAGKLVNIGCKYYIPGAVVPPNRQLEVITEYLTASGFAYRQDLADALHIEVRQCTRILKRYVEQGELVCRNQKYYLKKA